MKKDISIITILLLLFLSIQPANSVYVTTQNSSDIPESHLIKGIEYIAQTEGYFCYYSCFTMIFNYMGLNTTLDEVLFYDGLGYTHYYNTTQRLPDDACYSNPNFIFDLFGVEENWTYLEGKESSNENWDKFYTHVKENISEDTPVITRIDPFSIPSLRDQFKISDMLWSLLLPPSHHLILIVGYNDTNETICYMDPNAGFYGDESYGNYAWMSLDKYRDATEKNIWSRYVISSYFLNNTKNSPKERFEKAFNNNINRLNSNKSYGNWTLGINASNIMKNHFSEEEKEQTINLYKKYAGNGIEYSIHTMMQKILSSLYPDTPNIFDIFMVGKEDPFQSIAEEKQHIVNYLQNCDFYSDLCNRHSDFLKEEIKLWQRLSENYKVFLKKGKTISNLKANSLIKEMKITTCEIIQIQEQLAQDYIIT